ncbi:MAG: primosomal protein N', partial [Bacteroidales bacterium]|nr:primosomal protein N' [Bacteroidales bacterium]
FKQKNETFITLTEEYQKDEQKLSDLLQTMEAKRNTQEQANTILQLLFLQQKNKYPFVRKNELLQQKSVTESRISSLILKKIFVAQSLPVSRLPRFKSIASPDNIELTPMQNEAFNQICNSFVNDKKVLLHGVTGSGKTEIYIKLIQQTISKGQQVLYLLPEIALTEQIINRLRYYFGEKVGVYHSKYNVLQRAEIWNNLNSGIGEQFQIILGARSAIFLPFNKLGLIIIDEEHDNSYKQYEPSPRYNARDTAIMLANFHQANLLLGTATPAVETYYNTLVGKYDYVSLTERYKGLQLPNIELVDIKKAKFKGEMQEHFSHHLLTSIEQALAANEQVILFQNRRGFAPHIECPTCGYIPHCKNCDVTLTFHKHDRQLRCHYCGFSQKIIDTCPNCNTPALELKGFGTERIEEELGKIFPDIRIDRLDYDSTRNKNSFQQIIHNFENGKTNILVGTQMITKGLDFDNVSLVGVLNADNMLNYPDFRAFERAFQLLMQVSGRAGRKNKQGKVIIQTNNPQHDIFKYLQNYDNQIVINRLLNERKQFYYPPYCRIVKICLQHKDLSLLNNIATDYVALLRQYVHTPIFGPEDALIPKIKNMFRKEILIKLPIDRKLSINKKSIVDCWEEMKKRKRCSSVFYIVDVDPY